MLYLGRVMELGEAETVFSAPQHPYTEALLSSVPQTDGVERPRIRLEGEIPSHADPPSGCVFHTRCPRFIGDICVNEEPPLREVEPGHLWRCHHSLEALRELQKTAPPARRTARPAAAGGRGRRRAAAAGARPEGTRGGPRAHRGAARGRRAGAGPAAGPARCSCACTRAASATRTSTRSTARPRRAARPSSGTRAPGVVEAVGDGRRPRARRRACCSRGCRPAGVCEECLRELPHLCTTAWAGDGRAAGCSTARRGCRATASPSTTTRFLSTFAERAVVPARCCIPMPDDVPFDVAALVGCAITTGTGAGLADGRRAARATASRSSAAAASG